MRSIALVPLFLAAQPSAAMDSEARPFVGLQVVSVMVDIQNGSEGPKVRLDSNTLQTRTELALRRMGLRVVGPDEVHKFQAAGVFVEVRAIYHQGLGYTYLVALELMELCTPQRSGPGSILCRTWRSTETLGSGPSTAVPKAITESVDVHLREFENRLLEARAG